MWGVPALIVVLANNYFPYHYYIFVFPALIEIICCDNMRLFKISEERRLNYFFGGCFFAVVLFYLFVRLTNIEILQSKWILTFAVLIIAEAIYIVLSHNLKIIIAFGIPLVLSSGIYITYMSIGSEFVMDNIKYDIDSYKDAEIVFEMDRNQECMYLDAGYGAYMLGLKSYLNEYYPLPIQRIYEGSEYENRECHVRVLEKALSYKGKYLTVYEEWFFSDNRNNMLKEMIADNYHIIGTTLQWTMEYDIFLKPQKGNRLLKIYEKNEY
jgi:hypothetical protein